MIGSEFFIGHRASDWILKILKVLSNQRGRGHDAAIWQSVLINYISNFELTKKQKRKTKLTPAPNHHDSG
jgi:hypothetical protein